MFEVSKYVVLCDDNLVVGSLKHVNKVLGTAFAVDDFKRVGNNFIVRVSDQDLDFKRDIKDIENMAVRQMFRKEADVGVIVSVVNALLLVVLLLR